MNTITPTPFTARAMLALYLREAKYEFLRVLRTPAFSVPTLVFAPMFYVLFGVLLNRGNAQAASYLMATYSVFGIIGPANMPKDIAARLSSEFAKALNSPDVRDRLTQQGFTVVGGTPEEMGAFLKADVANFKRIIEASKMKAE